MDNTSFITVLCPVYNEEEYIENILDFFIKAQPQNKELILIDGGSTDRTVTIAEKWAANYNNIKLLHNPNRYVPFALNEGIKNSSGNPIIRLDAHTLYEPDYFEKILETFKKTNADIVGGPMRAIGKTSFQKALAYCTSTSFGIGNSQFHNEMKEGYVDSVYLGSWKRKTFEDAGLFDVQMKRNQDDEFHYRAKSKGKTIYLNPEIKSWYYPRKNFKSLFSQYFQYGLYKPLVLKKVSSEIKLRHIIPALFVLYLLSIPLLFKFIGMLSLAPLLFYLFLNIYFSLKKYNSFLIVIYKLAVYPTLHVSYGLGFITGLPLKPKVNNPVNNK